MRLHVNVDHVATLRNARGTSYPDPVIAACVCVEAGADGITAHLREDRRHILDDDVRRLRSRIKETFNLEMAPTSEMVEMARRIVPNVVTLVPERRQERTTEGGLDVAGGAVLRAHVKALQDAGVRVSLFIAPDSEQVEASRALGVEQVELHTGEYAREGADVELELDRLRKAAAKGRSLGLSIAAGHGLTRKNVVRLASILEIEELNIGHAMIADALFLALEGSVQAMREAIREGRGSP